MKYTSSIQRPGRLYLIPLLLLLLAGVSLGQTRQLFGKITFPLGDVTVQLAAGSDWNKAAMNQEVFAGDKVKTGQKSRLEISLNGGGKMRIGEKAEVELTEAKVTPLKKDFGATVKRGQVWVAARAAFGEKKNIAIRTPTAVAAIRGTKYRAVAGEKESSVLVYSGKVDVNWAEAADSGGKPGGGQGGAPQQIKIGAPTQLQAPTQVAGPYEVSLEDWITLVEGMQINVRADGKYSMFEFNQADDAQLEFVRWNKELDEQQGE